jgi:hypothetical protein
LGASARRARAAEQATSRNLDVRDTSSRGQLTHDRRAAVGTAPSDLPLTIQADATDPDGSDILTITATGYPASSPWITSRASPGLRNIDVTEQRRRGRLPIQ